ncbi:MAG: L-sorbosone dehydrogenase [Planctomycetota bacterium]
MTRLIADPLMSRLAHCACLLFAGLVLLLASCGSLFAGGLGVTPPDAFSVPDGFAVELVHEVEADAQGSWVSLTVDPSGRLIACDQEGGLFRIDLQGPTARVEPLAIDLAGAQGLLCAFGSLYANVNLRQGKQNGLWRLTDTDGDDQYDTKTRIVPLEGGSEHGPHAVILSPDQQRLIFVAGNNTWLPESFGSSRVPKVWSEDHLLPRMPDARGHNADRLAPGGFIMSCDPDGNDRELIATGFRNPYDIALNEDGELFTYDADMEWDVGTPWYRPTRINHVISGAEFGWRNGTGKWPAYYPDSFGSAVDIGPGSPTGICFGYGTNFPPQYRDALFIADWSYGNIHAVSLTEDGASYGGSYTTFATAAPLPVTDMTIHPDGCLYFAIGGRSTQSALYRIRYVGGDVVRTSSEPGDQNEPSDPIAHLPISNRANHDIPVQDARSLRHSLESLHVSDPRLSVTNSEATSLAFEHLGHDDRAIRFAARIALEHRQPATWKTTLLADSSLSSTAKIHGLIALARVGGTDDQSAATDLLIGMDPESLSTTDQVAWLRAAGLIAMRLGDFDSSQNARLANHLDQLFPTGDISVDRELAQMLIRLQVADATAAIVDSLENAPSQESQIHYAMALRQAKFGWTVPLRKRYLQWFVDIQSARGGRSFGGFITNIKKEVVASLSADTKQRLASVINPPKASASTPISAPRPFVRTWTVDDVLATIADSTHQPSFENGKAMFAAAQCYKCHRMGLQGGILGPDLTSAGGKFNVQDMLSSIIEPSRVISDQYGATQFLTEDGDIVTGRVINMHSDRLTVMTNMLDPSATTTVIRDDILETAEAKTSMMPSGLLDTLTTTDIEDLVAYLRSGGNAKHAIYGQPVAMR